MKNIWQDLPKPLFIQAPMEDVSDTVFRQMLLRYGRPDIFFTEFTSVEGMFSPGKEFVESRLKYSKKERPIIAQIWGSKPENFYNASKYIVSLGFDGIDINMGCPKRDVVKDGLCAGLIENHEKAHEIIRATQEGAGNLPVSVKTRIGINKIVTEEWIGFLLGEGLDAIIVHARTVKEMSAVPAHWDEIRKVVELRDKMKKKTIIVGNGDVTTRDAGEKRIAETGADGVMIGRGILNDITVFNKNTVSLTPEKRVEMFKVHQDLFYKTWKKRLSSKFIKMYIKDFVGASAIREKLIFH